MAERTEEMKFEAPGGRGKAVQGREQDKHKHEVLGPQRHYSSMGGREPWIRNSEKSVQCASHLDTSLTRKDMRRL